MVKKKKNKLQEPERNEFGDPVSKVPVPESKVPVPEAVKLSPLGRTATEVNQQFISNREKRIKEQIDKGVPPEAARRQFEAVQRQESELAVKQKQELQEIDLLKQNQEQPKTQLERNAAAGLAFVGSIESNLGIKNPIGADSVNPQAFGISKQVAGAIGVLSTTGIAGISLSTLFSPSSENIKNTQGDIQKNVAESTRILRAATSRGANIQQALKSQQLLEDSIRLKYIGAQQQLRISPKDIRGGLDLLDDMSRDLRIVVENRQALERFSLTGDPTEVLFLGGNNASP